MAVSARLSQISVNVSLNGTAEHVSSSKLIPSETRTSCRSSLSFPRSFGLSSSSSLGFQLWQNERKSRFVSSRHVAMQDSLPGMEEEPVSEPREYPPGMQRYESMVILRPDLTEDERTALIERYEEAMVAGGALDVEMFNRGMQPLAYNIKSKTTGGQVNRYVDGIYLLFTYVTKPQSQVELQKKFNTDDDIIRSTTFRLKL